MKVTFWGVRGSIATSGARFQGFGGNTTCIEVEHAGERLIIDAGTGLRPLGQKLLAESRESGLPVRATMLFTHLHWDHIQGFPFFAPAFVPSTELALHGPCENGVTLETTLARQMEAPTFPVPLAAMGARRTFGCLHDGAEIETGPFRIRTRALEHPQGSLGYRIEAGGRVFCFATDTEHPEDRTVDEALLELARGAELLVLDAQYTPDEYEGRAGPPRKGWGHSTHVAAVQAAVAAQVGRLGLFHHDPGHEDPFVERMERDARSLFPRTFATREGLSIDC